MTGRRFGNANSNAPGMMLRKQSTGVRSEEWEDEDALQPEAFDEEAAAAAAAAARKQEYGCVETPPPASGGEGSEEQEMEEARLEAYMRSMKELETKREVGRRTREARSPLPAPSP